MKKIFIAFVIISCMCVQASALDYDLSRMRQMNPDFTTYPAAQGIIWLKHVAVSNSENGGVEIERLFVIRGRRGLGGKWTNWNLQIPEKGNIEVLESSIYDPESGAKIGAAVPEENLSAGIKVVNFTGLPDNFILVMSWKENLTEELNIEGLNWFQEDLRVWESVLEITSPNKIAFKTFPERVSPETDEIDDDQVYTWRRVNLDPYNSEGEIARLSREGVAFGNKQGNSNLQVLMKNIENTGSISAPMKKFTPQSLITWLNKQPEIILAESMKPRKIPASGEWTRAEKIKLARYWLSTQKVNASLGFELPFDPDENTPLCEAMFYNPILHLQGVKGMEFQNLSDPKLLTGAKIFMLDNNKLTPRRLPSSPYAENKLSCIMNLKLNDDAMLNGTIRVVFKGGWSALLLGENPSDGTARGALLSLFPGLTNYENVKLRKVKGTPVITFDIKNKPGISGGGVRWLAMPPVFEPATVRNLAAKEAPIEILFPFIIEQNITIDFPKKGTQALAESKTPRNPDKINYTDESRSRRHNFTAESKMAVNMQTITAGNAALLQRCLNQWHAFSTRNIPVK